MAGGNRRPSPGQLVARRIRASSARPYASAGSDPQYPDVASPRTENFALIEILWSVGRSVKIKRKVVADIVAALAKDPGLDAEHVMIVFKETQWENWAFAGGRLLHG